jgi:hypothetical protein
MTCSEPGQSVGSAEPAEAADEYEFIEMPPLAHRLGELNRRAAAGDAAAGDEARRLYKDASEEDRAAHVAWSRTVDRYTASRHSPPSRYTPEMMNEIARRWKEKASAAAERAPYPPRDKPVDMRFLHDPEWREVALRMLDTRQSENGYGPPPTPDAMERYRRYRSAPYKG